MESNVDKEAEKRELERLLGTAKDEDRKEVIRKALASLDSPVKAQGKIASNHAHLLNAQKLPLDQVGKNFQGMRPLSARTRSQSNLEVIHEVTSSDTGRQLHHPVSTIVETNYHRMSSEEFETCTELSVEDISSITGTSYDPRFPLDKLLPDGSSGRNNRAQWISSGMVPQCIFIKLKQRMLVKQVEVGAQGVKKIFIKLSDGFRDLIPGTQMSSTSNEFLYSDKSIQCGILSSKPAIYSDGILLCVTDIDASFFSIKKISIFAEGRSKLS